MQNLKPLSRFVFFFALACERIFTQTHSIESRCYRIEKHTVCRRVRASFSPDLLQAGAVNGLIDIFAYRQVQAGINLDLCSLLFGINV